MKIFWLVRRSNVAVPGLAGLVAATCFGCSGTGGENGSYVDKTDEPLMTAADGRLRDLGVECRLQTGVEASGTIEMVIENKGTDSLEVLSRGTPWDRYSAVVDVRVEEQALPYKGIIASRNSPTDEEFIKVAPGESVTASYDLNLQHQATQQGRYEIALKSPLFNVRLNGSPLAIQHDCGVLHASLSPVSKEEELGVIRAPLIFVNSSCSLAEQTQVNSTENLARSATQIAKGFTVANNSLYLRWFGTWSPARALYVNTVVADIDSLWPTFEGDCDVNSVPACSGTNVCSGANAWVCAGDDANRVHLCDGYFSNPPFSVEAWSNQLGILVHEKSHLVSGDGDQSNAVCTEGGDTACYGAPDARALAIQSPTQATKNGENYEKFVSDVYLNAVLVPSVL